MRGVFELNVSTAAARRSPTAVFTVSLKLRSLSRLVTMVGELVSVVVVVAVVVSVAVVFSFVGAL